MGKRRCHHGTPNGYLFPRYVLLRYFDRVARVPEQGPLRYVPSPPRGILGTTEDGGRLGKVEGEEEAMHTHKLVMHAQYVCRYRYLLPAEREGGGGNKRTTKTSTCDASFAALPTDCGFHRRKMLLEDAASNKQAAVFGTSYSTLRSSLSGS